MLLPEIGRRILRLSKHHSNLSIRLGLRLPSVKARIFILKLSLVHKLNESEDSIGGHIMACLPKKSIRLMQECRYLEDKLSCQGFTDAILTSQSSLKEKKREVLKIDWDSCIKEASCHSSTATAANVAVGNSWL